MKYNWFIGRFQPLHQGHIKLIRKVLDKGKNVFVVLRDTGKDEKNPYTFEERFCMFFKEFREEIINGRMRVDQFKGVDCEEINHGRDWPIKVVKINLDEETEKISATEVRKKMRENKQLFSPGKSDK